MKETVLEIPTMKGIDLLEEKLPGQAHVQASDGHIDFEGIYNARDLGGIVAAGGKRIASRRLIRSSALDTATENDIDALINEFHVVKVLNLCTEEERLRYPDPIDAMPDVEFINIPILSTATLGITREGGLKGLTELIRKISEDPFRIMSDIYPKLFLYERSLDGFRKFFSEVLKTEDGAVLWHCSAGKDRAGVAAYLLLLALGVSDAAATEDYLASNKYMRSRNQDLLDQLAQHDMAEKLDNEVRVMNSADERFLKAGTDAAVQEYGSMKQYLREALNIDDGIEEVLRSRYLESGGTA